MSHAENKPVMVCRKEFRSNGVPLQIYVFNSVRDCIRSFTVFKISVIFCGRLCLMVTYLIQYCRPETHMMGITLDIYFIPSCHRLIKIKCVC